LEPKCAVHFNNITPSGKKTELPYYFECIIMTLDWLKRLLQRGCCTSYSLTSTHDDFEVDEEAIDLSAESFPNALESGSSVVSEWQEEALRCKIEQDPKNWQTHYYLGSVLVEQEGKFEEAERHLKLALLFNPYHVESYFSLAYSYHEQGNFSKAIQTFLIALKLDGRNAELWTGLGSAYKADQQLENAFGAYRNAIAIDPLFTMPYYNLGNLYYEVGDTEHAITLFMQCLRIDPSHTGMFINWIGNWLVAATFPLLLEALSPKWTFIIFIFTTGFFFFFTYKFVPETKGRTIAEISRMFKSNAVVVSVQV